MAQPPISGVIETNVLPPIPVSWEAEQGPGWAAWVRPALRLDIPLIGRLDVAPYGEPSPGLGGVVFIALVALAAYGAWRLIRR